MFNYEARIENAKKVIKEADYILIGAGAGLSTAAGLEYSGDKFKNKTKCQQKKNCLQLASRITKRLTN